MMSHSSLSKCPGEVGERFSVSMESPLLHGNHLLESSPHLHQCSTALNADLSTYSLPSVYQVQGLLADAALSRPCSNTSISPKAHQCWPETADHTERAWERSRCFQTHKFSKHQSLLLASLLRLGYFPLNNISQKSLFSSPKFLSFLTFHLPEQTGTKLFLSHILCWELICMIFYSCFSPTLFAPKRPKTIKTETTGVFLIHEKKEPCKTSSQKMTDVYLCIFCVFLYYFFISISEIFWD